MTSKLLCFLPSYVWVCRLTPLGRLEPRFTTIRPRDHFGYGLGQWEKALHSNASSHWLSPYLEWSLQTSKGQFAYTNLNHYEVLLLSSYLNIQQRTIAFSLIPLPPKLTRIKLDRKKVHWDHLCKISISGCTQLLDIRNKLYQYRQISNIRCTKFQNLNVSRLVLPLSQSIEAMC